MTETAKKRRLGWLAALIALLLAVRVALPHLVRAHLERELDAIEGFESDIGGVDLSLWRGAYRIEDLEIVKTDADIRVPFISTPVIELSLQWTELFHGAFVGEMVFRSPVLNLVAGPSDQTRQTGWGVAWARHAEDLSPVRINRLEIFDGTVHFRNFHSEPEVDIYLSELRGETRNLTNSRELSETLAASAEVSATVMDDSPLEVHIVLDPYNQDPTFDLDLSLEGLDLIELNEFLRAYANVDVSNGTFSLYTELAASDGRFDGYLKPIFEDVDVLRLEEDDGKNPLRLAWEALIELAAELLENQPKDRLATRIPYSGSIDDPDVDLLSTIGSLLRNAFIQAIAHGLEGSVEPGTVAAGAEEPD